MAQSPLHAALGVPPSAQACRRSRRALQDISEPDAIAEGIMLLNGRYTFNGSLHESRTAVGSYRALWESLHGPEGWHDNPWIWALTFRRVERVG